MSSAKVLNLIGLALVALAAAADCAMPRLAVPRPEALAVDRFPRVIGAWSAGANRPVDPQIAARLTTATIVERDYRNPTGHDIDLLLVTADRDQDIHDPSLCLPAQGWNLGERHVLWLDRQEINEVDIDQSGARYAVLYWLADYTRPARPSNMLLACLMPLRRKIVRYHEGASLLVRLVAREQDRAALERFAGQVMPAIDALRRRPHAS